MNNIVRIVAAFALSLGTISAAQAHGIWFAQRATQLALIYGIGADDLDSVKRQPLVKSVAGYDAEWKPIVTSLRVAGPLLLVETESQPTIVTAVLENGVWSKTPDGEWIKKGKDEVPNAVISEHTVKYTTAIRGPLSSQIPALPDQTLQVVPVGTAIPVTLGKPIKVRVLFQGKPVKGAEVIADFVNDPDGKPLKSAANGIVTLKVRNQGLNVIAATYVGPADDPTKVDRVEYRATLTFVLPHAPE
ncbi:MAG: DUF4198 domain-containing protein [Rhodospirillaceae bacterium]|nr:MAG: DUF4198 domain-containing protein [Rhodospirillaceae bacterium]